MSESEHRRGPRIPRTFVVRYRTPQSGQLSWGMSTLRDLSSSGARFLSEQPFAVGALLELKLRLPVSQQPVALQARVAWVKPAPLGMCELGVTFQLRDAESQRSLDASVAYFAGKKPS
ncbi:MAG: PilZ domain-containing protein [Candidatus Omnitrophica bacterium]|nr:PilZ domain-containing protein [Candidatus Omnitrophota bacterium]